MPKISALPPLASADAADEAPIVDTSTTTTKKWTLTLLLSYLQSLTAWLTPSMHSLTTREFTFPWIGADAGGGAVLNYSVGPAIAFTGTPGAFARITGRVPDDYAGGNVTINLYFRATDTNTGETTNYYLGCSGVGDVYSSWNIASNITSQSVSFSTTVSKLTLNTTIPDASIDAGDIIQIAWRPSSALTGTVYLIGATMSYSSNS